MSDAAEAESFLKNLAEQLPSPQDTKIEKIVAMWHGEHIDLPSYALRDMLCRLNPDNLETDILILTIGDYQAKSFGKQWQRDIKKK